MNFSKFFIDRPIFAGVLSVLIVLAGLIAMRALPISEYPEVSPPSVVVRAQYPGANPKVIAETVATPLEESINGVEGMLYMGSQATTDGVMTLTVTFKLGTDPDKAQQLVQNRVSQAEPRLPEEVRRLGVTTIKSAPDLTMVVHLVSPNKRYDMTYLRNYAVLNVKDRLARIDGVGQVQIFGGGDYSMRVWLDPQKVAQRGLSASDVVAAIRGQNVQAAAGVVGASPGLPGVDMQLSINAQGRLQTEEEFGDIIVKTGADGAVTRLRDIGRLELGSAEYSLRSLLNNDPAVGMGLFQAPGSNALDISTKVRATMDEIQKSMPQGVEYRIAYDPTQFVRASIDSVEHTLLEAIVLVVLVVILFLQTWRASIIPLLAVPVSVIGTFAVLHILGFSINALSLFGLVLAIGIVVDDAIVVVENVERNIEAGLSPREATYKAMREVSGPIVAIALVLVAVFVPLAFISGLTGQFYRQFAVTIAISTVISAINSLTLSPALAALLLKGHDEPKDALTRGMDRAFGWLFRGFNRLFHRGSEAYSGGVKGVISRKSLMMVVYLVLVAATFGLFKLVPSGFVPAQDKQYLIGFAQLPDGATLDRTEDVVRRMGDIMKANPNVEDALAFPGLSINGFTNSSNSGVVFATLKSFDERKKADQSGNAIAGQLNQKFAGIQDAFIAIFPPPPVAGLGTTGGFKLQIEDRASLGYDALDKAVKAFMAKASQTPQVAGLFTSWQVNVPQLYADIDRTKARQLGVPVTDIFETMQIYLGSLYANDFNQFGRTYTVRVQADAPYRARAEDVGLLKVRSVNGDMVPLSAVMKVNSSFGPERAMRYNGYLTADINGAAAPGFSSGQAQDAIERIAKETLPQGISFEWTELTYQEILAGNSAFLVFPLAILLVFLVLAAQYESLTLPLSIILIVPMGLLAAMTGVWLSHGDNNIFTQIGLIVLVGLSAKNAILIVEFARELELEGRTPVQAAIEASRLRLRPILMTSLAFIMGVLPLVLATGAGSEMRKAMGVAVFAGMIGVTAFGLFLTPVFYVLLRKLAGNRPLKTHGAAIVGTLVTAAVLAGCSIAPATPASFAAPTQFKEIAAAQGFSDAASAPVSGSATDGRWTRTVPAESQPRGQWWLAFGDPVMNTLVERAGDNNADIQQAASRLAEARAIARSVDADRSPQIGVGAGIARQRGYDTLAGARPTTIGNAGVSIAYEPDLFGRLAGASNAAELDAEGRAALLQSTRLAVQAQTAQTYLTLRAIDSERSIVADTVAAYRDTLRVTQRRQAAGDVGELDVARVQTELASTESDALTLDRRRAAFEHALAVLVGDVASNFGLAPADWSTALPAIPAGVPSTVLTRRPDVSQAQSAVLAAQARLGVAQTAWFPDVSLTGSGGFAAPRLGDLVQWSMRSWGIGAVLSLPVFDGGRRKADVAAASARLDGALVNYRSEALVAFKEVEDQLAELRLLDQQAQVQDRAVTSALRATTLSDIRYRAGMVSQLDLLDARRSELRNRREALQVRSAQYQSTVGLIKALGGGWESAVVVGAAN